MKVTREGKRFILAAVLIGFAALNTGNNLIYLIFSLMLSFIVLAIVLLRINLSGISMKVSLDRPVYAGEQASALLTIQNRKKRVPAYSLRIVSSGVFSPVYCAFVGPRDAVSMEIKMTFQRRGLYSHRNFFLQSGFPFILCEKSTKAKVGGEALIYPALMDVEQEIPDLLAVEGPGGPMTSESGNEVRSLREFRDGDDWRSIHWKASAKASKLMVKEYSLADTRKITLLLDNLLPSGGEVFEKNVSLAASLAQYFLHAGYLVRLVSCKKIISFGSGSEHLFKMLDILALIKEEDAFECPLSEDREGFSVLLLKSSVSSFRSHVSSADMVINADFL